MLIARDLLRAVDPVQLARDCGIEADDWQAQLLIERPKRALLLCARQTGKSTVTALMALHTALYDPGLILLLSPSQRQSAELHRTVMGFYAKLDGAPEITEESALRTTFSTGARIIALPGSTTTTRGYSAVRLAVVDEASRVDDQLYGSIRPMLGTSDGSLIMLSTPAGRRGKFFEAWTEGGPSWTRVSVSASECPRLSEEFLREERAQLGDAMFRQEYCLEFLTDGESVFDVDLFKHAFSHPNVEVFF